MKTVTHSLGMSLDGYVVDSTGGFDWTKPDDEEFQFVTEEIRR